MFSNNSGSNIVKSWWKKIPLPVRMKIIGICAAVVVGGFLLITIVATIYNVFHGGFSTISGTEPTASTIPADDKANGVEQQIHGYNDNEVPPGNENANEIYNSYYNEDGTPNVGAGLDLLKKCDKNLSFTDWLTEVFTDKYANACSLIRSIDEEATKKENEFSTYNLIIDRGLIISTFVYAYAASTSDEEAQQHISAADPYTILEYMVKHQDNDFSGVRVKPVDIKNLIDAQVLVEDYVSLSYGKIISNDFYHPHTYTTTVNGEEVEVCESIYDSSDYFYGCTSSEQYNVKFSLEKYKLYLRDRTDKNDNKVAVLGGWAPANISTDHVKAYDKSSGKSRPVMKYDTNWNKGGLYGYTGANSYEHTVSSTSAYCNNVMPTFSGGDGLAIEDGTYWDYNTCDGDIEKHPGQFVEVGIAQNFIQNITTQKLNDPNGFINTKANHYNIYTPDNFNFQYNNQTFTVNYEKGFINEKFDFVREEEIPMFRHKNVERTIDIIVDNALTMNKAMNFKYDAEGYGELGEVASRAVVIGDEANPMGDFPYKVTSTFGERRRYQNTRGEWKEDVHGGVDLAGSGCLGTGIYAWKDGTVTVAGYDSDGYGNYVFIDHEALGGKKVRTVYAHMKTFPLVSKGQQVKAGTLIGQCGATGNVTGPHLHFEVRVDGVKADPCLYITVGRTCADAK